MQSGAYMNSSPTLSRHIGEDMKLAFSFMECNLNDGVASMRFTPYPCCDDK